MKKLIIAIVSTLLLGGLTSTPAHAGGWSWSPKYLFGSSAVEGNPNLINCHYRYFLMYDGIAFYEYRADFVESIYTGCPAVRP